MTKTFTVKGKVSEAMKARLDEIVSESGRDEERLVGEAVEQLVRDDLWIRETKRRLDRPDHERLGHDPDEMDRYIEERASGKPTQAPEAKPLSQL